MKIDEIGLPDQLKTVLDLAGYNSLYPPQIEAIKAGALEGRNIVLASPTASGKTLVAELCIIHNTLEGEGKSLYLTPLRALANEKYEEFQKYKNLKKRNGESIKIAISTGDFDSADEWLEKYDIIVSTNEKVDSLLRHRTPWMDEIRTVVADEIHLLTDQDRGPTLEITLTKLMELNPEAQILALSATVRNAEDIARWIGGVAITTDWRPVPLKEGVYYGGEIQFKDGSARRVTDDTGKPSLDIALEVVREGGQALVFTETRKAAVEYGKIAASTLSKELSNSQRLELEALAKRIVASGEKTKLSELLAQQVLGGAAFHHAGLTGTHRKIVEDSFKAGTIKILAATPTLASGVNTPARVVLITSYRRYDPGYGRSPISVLEYKQFSGRAGRPKYDMFGEAVLIAKTHQEREYLMETYVCGEPEKVWSKLSVEKVLRPHVLSTIATGFAYTEEDLHQFFSKTFHAQQYDLKSLRVKVGRILKFLFEESMVEMRGGRLTPTRFGRRVSELYIDPVSAVIIRNGLSYRPKKLTEISLLQLVSHTPDITPRPYPRGMEIERLNLYAEEHADEFILKTASTWCDTLLYEQDYEDFLSELKCVSVLQDWIEEMSEDRILEKHKVEPGDLLRLTQTAEWLIYATHELARLLEHTDILRKLAILKVRIRSGVREELVPLVQIEGVGRVRARMLYNSGFHTVEDLRRASLSSLTAVPTIGDATAKKIKKQVGEILTTE
ncbi:MAG: DEAD/DEAH box helicase [Candidatus Bathyarchaeia archaeon]